MDTLDGHFNYAVPCIRIAVPSMLFVVSQFFTGMSARRHMAWMRWRISCMRRILTFKKSAIYLQFLRRATMGLTNDGLSFWQADNTGGPLLEMTVGDLLDRRALEL